MTWIRFDNTAEPAPSLQLPTLQGAPTTVSDWRGRANGLVLFAHGPSCVACTELVLALAAQATALRENDAEVLVILPTLETALPAPWTSLPVVADPTGALRRQYAALIEFDTPRDVMLFVLNQYTVPHVAWVGREAQPALATEALEWLEILVCRCTTCGGPRFSNWEEAELPEWES